MVLDSEATLVVPVISLLEAFRWVLSEHSEAQGIQVIAAMQRGLVGDLDSIILATA